MSHARIGDQVTRSARDRSVREVQGEAAWGASAGAPRIALHYRRLFLNPVHTHFSLLFDRLTEALQQAAQDEGYNYDNSWLPWDDEVRSYDRLEDQQKADEQLAVKT